MLFTNFSIILSISVYNLFLKLPNSKEKSFLFVICWRRLNLSKSFVKTNPYSSKSSKTLSLSCNNCCLFLSAILGIGFKFGLKLVLLLGELLLLLFLRDTEEFTKRLWFPIAVYWGWFVDFIVSLG